MEFLWAVVEFGGVVWVVECVPDGLEWCVFGGVDVYVVGE